MKLVDANLLIYAVDEEASHHAAARAWLEDLLSGTETVALPWLVLLAFLRLTTQPRLFARPLAADEALDVVESWLDQPCVVTVGPTVRHAARMRELLRVVGAAGNHVGDAHLAALAIEHGAELCSADTDFARFPGLRWTNPVAPPA